MAVMDFSAANTREKVRKMLAPTKPAELSASALTDDTLRDNIISEAEKRTPRFEKAIHHSPDVTYTDRETGETQTHKWTTYPECIRDIARAGFEYAEPGCKPVSEVRPSHRLNRAIVEAFMASPQFAESRPYTRNSELESMYSAMAAAGKLQELAQEKLAEHIATSEQIGEAEQDQQTAEQMFENLRKQARKDIADDGSVQPGTRKGIKQALKNLTAAQQNLQNLIQQQAGSHMVVDAIDAANQAAAEAADAVDAISSLPGVDPGQAQVLSADKQMALAEKWKQNPDMRRIAQLLGRMLRSFRFKRSARSKNVKIEPVGVETGNDLRRLLPHELARGFSDNPLVKTTFMKDYSERALLQYDMRGKSPAGKGPIICLWDGSVSMQGEPFIWASSVALTLLMTAQREKRAFMGIEFGSGSEMASWFFPKGEPADPDRVLEMTGHFFGGGTDTTVGFREALRCLHEEDAFKTADVILIGDGQDRFGDDDKKIRDQIHDLGARIHGITIMTGDNPYFNQMCDWHADVVDLANNDVMDKLAENIT